MGYHGRPSISPVVAGLFAAGLIKKSHSVLDAGCGTGTDCLTLASWGVRRVVGLDEHEASLKQAKQHLRRLENRLQGEMGEVEWHLGSVTKNHGYFADESFDVILDTLLYNNLTPQARTAYLKQSARILKPGGLFIIQYRESQASRFGIVPPKVLTLPRIFRGYFDVGDPVVTDLIERKRAKRAIWGCGHIIVVVGRRRSRSKKKPQSGARSLQA